MSVMAHEPLSPGDHDVLLESFLALDTPEGFRAELIDGEIVVTPPPGSRHEKNIGRIVWQIAQKSSTDFEYLPNKGLYVPSATPGRSERMIPDATFAPAGLGIFDNDDSWIPADGIAMVVEVTSSRAERDRVDKRHGYARAEIPLYLLVDREKETATLFAAPADGDYHRVAWVPFGDVLSIPKPFDIDLDTSQLV
ncbi:Uma2 family endonuclease [Spirillospora sp. NPDC049024]